MTAIHARARAVLGFSGALGNVELGTYLMQNAPKSMLARVTSTGRLLSFGGGHYITMADSLILATAAEPAQDSPVLVSQR